MRFFVDGIPVAQARPRFARLGNHVKAYDPAKSKDWKAYVAMVARSKGVRVRQGALRVSMSFSFLKPKSAKKRAHHTVRPDLDNLVKGCKDALTGIAWVDDSQVVEIEARKFYGDTPGVEIEVVEIAESW